ncbi:Adaptive-response sensory-kinase SasA [Dyadobacter sp. CECT 9275]|uniref:histidine kinase n=1 Tax=Dyadobacter helix TaxID=2822344 RepID=A0A916N3V7_9BACT|nr:HAMP domain-containing sensor histidine kinase [Dyadobacter sp. CECT 9275]CAG4988349.1 Adaptive-response sensory-kinase SasA [Dyadobacter sp. CECT 9275]
MTRSRMTAIVALMCTAIAAVVILQGSWLLSSYAVSKEKNEVEVKALLDLAVTEQKRQTADSVRGLIRQLIRSDKDFKYRILNWPSGVQICFAGRNQNTFAKYAASAEDTVALQKDPYDFLIKKMARLKLDELDPLYVTLIGMNRYADNTPEKDLQQKLSSSFRIHEQTAGLATILRKTFSQAGRPFQGNIRCYNDISSVYNKPKKINLTQENVSQESVSVFSGSDNSRSLAIKLDLLKAFTDSLNQLGDSTFVAKPLLYDVNNILTETVPTFLLSVHTPSTWIGKQMSAGIFGSFALMIFIMLALLYMYQTILKQKQLSNLKNDFISNISHELKTPIATALAAVQGLKFFDLGQNPEKASSYLTAASSEIQRLSLMADKILNISLYESPSFMLSTERFDFKAMLTGVVDTQQARLEKPVTITLDYTADAEIFGDKTQLQNVVINLIDNAIKYSGPEARIHIRCSHYAGGIEMSVSDEGNGIPAEYRDFVFDKFFRVPAAAPQIKGYGLGLSYVKMIIEKHRGSIVLADSGKHGSKFIIKLPQQ